MERTATEIVNDFKERNYPHQTNIPGNKVFYTDSTASTLVWYEGNVVIEYYLLFPNVNVPLHWHPFDNQMIFLGGELTGFRKYPDRPTVFSKKFTDADCNYQGTILPAGHEHGFITGPMGAWLYNIQIWPVNVENPLSAAIEYLGPNMGPMHEQSLREYTRLVA
jgi:hypothetical protein